MIFPIISIYFLGEPVGNTWQVTEAKAAHTASPAKAADSIAAIDFSPQCKATPSYGMYDIHNNKPWPWSNKSTTNVP